MKEKEKDKGNKHKPGSSVWSDYGLDDRGSIPGMGKGFFL
jgi:hypothetical protein